MRLFWVLNPFPKNYTIVSSKAIFATFLKLLRQKKVEPLSLSLEGDDDLVFSLNCSSKPSKKTGKPDCKGYHRRTIKSFRVYHCQIWIAWFCFFLKSNCYLHFLNYFFFYTLSYMKHVLAFTYTTESTSGISTEAEVCCHYLSIHIHVYALLLQKRCEY